MWIHATVICETLSIAPALNCAGPELRRPCTTATSGPRLSGSGPGAGGRSPRDSIEKRRIENFFNRKLKQYEIAGGHRRAVIVLKQPDSPSGVRSHKILVCSWSAARRHSKVPGNTWQKIVNAT